MRTKPAILAFFALATISMQGLLTSCAGDENLGTEKQKGLQTLKINLNAVTRSAVYTEPTQIAENTINSVTIGIFGSDNKVKTIQEQTTSSTNPSITTSQLVAGDQVLVAVNTKAGTFNGALTVSDFENKTLAIDDALAGGSGSAITVANTKLPMFGTGIITQVGTTTAYEATVPVYHMVAKITLKSLNVDFDATGAYNLAKFKPTEVFMYNVPDKLDFYPANTMTSYSTFATYANLCQGENGVSANLKDYLGSGSTTLTDFTPANGILSGVGAAKGGTTYNWGSTTAGSKILFLYTMPNSSATPTRLVIKGEFDSNGDGTADPGAVYYPVNINYNSGNGSAADGGTVKQVYPNQNYIIDVTIKGKGASSPSASLDPQTATAKITVQSFVDAPQSNVFN